MNGSSELSDALNPNYFYGRQNVSHHFVPTTQDSAAAVYHTEANELQAGAVTPIYAAHRSELETAISPDDIPAQSQIRTHAISQQTQADPLRLLTTLMKSLKAYKDAVEAERRRRIAWEKAQEAKCLERHVELQGKLNAMQEEVTMLKDTVHLLQDSTTAALHRSSQPPDSSVHAEPGHTAYQSEFEQGSSGQLTARKRPRSVTPSGDDGEPAKSRNRLDSRPQSIHAAMRSHILFCMDLQSDKNLPPSHEEGIFLSDSEPVRFIWDQTTKKSLHNAKMKTRIVSELLARKDQFPLISEKEFVKEKLDVVFEQSFTTLRQKYAAQLNGDDFARAREEKSRRSRRSNRKKSKLNNRVAIRDKIPEVSHSTFDAAFQIEYLSSEESAEDENAMGLHLDDEGQEKNKVLFIRYLAWRSTRLHHLYELVDRREEQERSTKPKRGVGRIPRRLGQPKDGNPLPPVGTPSWMVSKRWMRTALASNPHLAKTLGDIVKPDDDESTWQTVSAVLGDESDDDEQPQQLPVYHDVQMPQADQYQGQYYMNAQDPQAWSENVGGYMDYSQNGPGVQHYPAIN